MGTAIITAICSLGMGMRSCPEEEETAIWMSADFHSLFTMWKGFVEAGSGGPCFHISFKELTNHSISSLLCAWQTFVFGTGGEAGSGSTEIITEVFLFDSFLTVI